MTLLSLINIQFLICQVIRIVQLDSKLVIYPQKIILSKTKKKIIILRM